MKGVRVLALVLLLFVFALPGRHALALVDINTADSATLQTLNGIGAVKAQAIIDYRTQHGPFTSIDQIQNVTGIGPATYAKIQGSITVTSTSSGGSQQDTTTPNDQQNAQQQTLEQEPVASSYVPPPIPSLYADAGNDRTVIVAADTEFDARAYDSKGQPISGSVRFAWNFGDGGSAEGQAVLHHFSYPGRYNVVLSIAEDKSAGRDEVIVTAEPAKLSFVLMADGGVAIENLAGHNLDLSGWVIQQEHTTYAPQFILPSYSKILADAAMQISPATLGFTASKATILEYPNGVIAFPISQTRATSSAPVAALSTSAVEAPAPVPAAPVVRAARAPAAAPVAQTAAAAASIAATDPGSTSPVTYWTIAAVLSVLAGIGTYFLQRLMQPKQEETASPKEQNISGWRIIEEKPSGD